MMFPDHFSTPFYEYVATEKGVFKILGGGNMARVSNFLGIKFIYHNIDTGEFQAEIAYTAFDDNKTVIVPRKDYLQRKGLLNLQFKGLDVTESNASSLTKYFREEENRKMSSKKNVHSTLGFSQYQGKLIFKHQKAIGIDSDYIGSYDIAPRGSYEEYLTMLKKEVFGNTPLETIVSASISSILLGYLGTELGLESTIIHLVADSTTGKSTALKLAISVFSSCDIKANSLFSSYNATPNSLIQKLTGLNGFPYALDEISVSNMQNFTSFIYALANGTEKERLNKDSILMPKKSWISNIFSNGERSLVGSANKNRGIPARIIEIKNYTFTRDAQNAENIQRTIQHSYGHLGYKFAEYLVSLEKKDLIDRYEAIRTMLFDKFTKTLVTDDLLSRRTAKFAIILLSAELLQDFLKITIQIEKMVEFFMQIEKDSLKTRNFNDSVIDYIKDFISINIQRFSVNDPFTAANFGRIQKKKDYVEVSMNKTTFRKMLSDGHYEDADIVLKELKKTGNLSSDKDRFTRTRKNTLGFTEEVYVLKLDDTKIMHILEKVENPEIPEEIVEVDII